MDRKFMILKIKLTPVVHLFLPFGYKHVYDHNSQTSILVYKISGKRLQDHLILWLSLKTVGHGSYRSTSL